MRAVIKDSTGPGFAYQADYPEPGGPGDGEVLLRIEAASLCGTDRELYEWTDSAQSFKPVLPIVQGHEGSGTVVALGPGVDGIKVGQLVALESHLVCGTCYACRTGQANLCANTLLLGMHHPGLFAEYVVVPADICVPVPEGTDPRHAALLESLGVGLHAIQRADYAVAGRSVLVSGCGPIGLAIIQMSRSMGASAIVAIEPNAFRREMAQSMGAIAIDTDVSPTEVLAGTGLGRELFDVSFEVSGFPPAVGNVIAATQFGGTTITVGHPGSSPAVPVAPYINKRGITLRGIFGRRLWTTWEGVADLLAAGHLDLEAMITNEFGLHQIDEAIESLSGEECKVIINPQLTN